MKKIAILFNDNDFYMTFRGVLSSFKHAISWADVEILTKPQIVMIINELSTGMYMLWQNQFEYGKNLDESWEQSFERTGRYLKISEDDILLNEEVDKYLEGTDWDNGETYIMDASNKHDIKISIL